MNKTSAFTDPIIEMSFPNMVNTAIETFEMLTVLYTIVLNILVLKEYIVLYNHCIGRVTV